MAKKARVLGISPNLKGANLGINRLHPPMGLGYILQTTKEQGHEVAIHDSALAGRNNHKDLGNGTIEYGQTDEQIAAVISNFSPDIVAVTMPFANLEESAHNVFKIAKRVNLNITTILGGGQPSARVRDFFYVKNNPHSRMRPVIPDLEDTNLDYLMHGECDFAFPQFVQHIADGTEPSRTPGLVMRLSRKEDGTHNYLINPAPEPPEMDSLPISPMCSPEMMKDYIEEGAFHHPWAKVDREWVLAISRGCFGKCTYCTARQMFGSKVRYRSPEHVAKQTEVVISDWKVKGFQVLDDLFNADKRMALKHCDNFEKIGQPWCLPNGIRANAHTKTPELMTRMKESGCYLTMFAIESGSQRVLDRAQKELDLKLVKPATEMIRDIGIKLHGFFMVGFPYETFAEMCQTAAFATTLRLHTASFAIYNPIPGTDDYRLVEENNLWWPGRDLSTLKFRSSLTRVDGFNSPEQFETFAAMLNKMYNAITPTREPKEWADYVGDNPNAYKDRVT